MLIFNCALKIRASSSKFEQICWITGAGSSTRKSEPMYQSIWPVGHWPVTCPAQGTLGKLGKSKLGKFTSAVCFRHSPFELHTENKEEKIGGNLLFYGQIFPFVVKKITVYRETIAKQLLKMRQYGAFIHVVVLITVIQQAVNGFFVVYYSGNKIHRLFHRLDGIRLIPKRKLLSY